MPRDTTQNIHRNFSSFFEFFTNISYITQHTTEKGISFSFNLHTVEKQEYIHTYVYILQNLAKRHNQSDSLNL